MYYLINIQDERLKTELTHLVTELTGVTELTQTNELTGVTELTQTNQNMPITRK